MGNVRGALVVLAVVASCTVGAARVHAREVGDGAFVPLRDVAWAFPVTRVVASSASGPAAARRLALGFGIAPIEWLALEGGLELGGALVRARDGTGELRAGGELRVGLGV